MTALVIAGTGVRRDAEGRYSLNDLHRAAGGEKRHQPSDWLRLQQTQGLVDAVSNSGESRSCSIDIVAGRYGGTYVAKELVYAYAMWISPAFHLKVIRAYDELVTAPVPADPLAVLNSPETLRMLLLGYAERVIGLEQTVAAQAPKVEALDRIADARGAVCLTDAAKALQVRRIDLINWMQEHSWIHKREGTNWKAYQPRITSGHLVHKVVTRGAGVEERIYDQVLVTPKGLARLAELAAGRSGPLVARAARA